MLNRPFPVNKDAINRLSPIECNVLLDEFPTVLETEKAIQHLSSGKTLGADAIPAEIYNAGGLPMAEKTYIVVSLHVEEVGYPTGIQGCTSSTILVNGDAYILSYRLHTYLGLNINGSPY